MITADLLSETGTSKTFIHLKFAQIPIFFGKYKIVSWKRNRFGLASHSHSVLWYFCTTSLQRIHNSFRTVVRLIDLYICIYVDFLETQEIIVFGTELDKGREWSTLGEAYLLVGQEHVALCTLYNPVPFTLQHGSHVLLPDCQELSRFVLPFFTILRSRWTWTDSLKL